MRFSLAPPPLLHLITTVLSAAPLVSALPGLGEVSFDQLFARQACAGDLCGFSSQLCCPKGGCYTDANTRAQCSTPTAAVTPAAATATTTGGHWTVVTATYTSTGAVAITSTYSTYVAGVTGASTPQCNYALNQNLCGTICCASDQWCDQSASVCSPIAYGGSSGYYTSYYSTMYATTDSAGVPLRPTSSTLIIVTATGSTTSTARTEPFQTPISTGANVTFTSSQSTTGGGLSGGAIAGIVIGVLAGLLLLGLLCFYCCLKGVWDLFAGIFGLGRKRERKEVDIYERRTHHSSSGGAAGRTWYGAARPARRDDRDRTRRSSEGKTLLGVGAGLAALWAILGLKRRERKRNEEKYSEYSYSSDYYTSESSASSDDRRTRDTRHSLRR